MNDELVRLTTPLSSLEAKAKADQIEAGAKLTQVGTRHNRIARLVVQAARLPVKGEGQ